MEKKIFKNNHGVVAGLCLIVALSMSNIWARGGRNHGYYGGYYHGYYHGFYHGYHGWGFYWPYWGNFAVYAPPLGAYVEFIPDGYTTVIVGGIPYYYYDGYYFRPYSSGYVIVQPPVENPNNSAAPAASAKPQASSDTASQPLASSGSAAKSQSGQAVAAQPKATSSDTAIINIPNSSGGYTPVKLIKHNNGYLGPQGEFYPRHPTVDQLKALYGN